MTDAFCDAVVVAAGEGKRFGSDKTFADLNGVPVLAHSIAAFEQCGRIARIALVLSGDNLARGNLLCRRYGWTKVTCCAGGARRQDSVRAGLSVLSGASWVAIHDGARPLITPAMIERGIAAAQAAGAAVAAVRTKDTIKIVGNDDVVVDTPDRRTVWVAQTPQVFRYATILAAHESASDEVTDDATLLERLGIPVAVYDGSYDNIKITTPQDLLVAQCLLEARTRGAG